MRILGIDPGLQRTGYGCLEFPGGDLNATPRVVEAGVLAFRADESVASRLVELEADLCALIGRVEPERVAVEALYAHHAHPRTAIVMAHARGVILMTVQKMGKAPIEVPATEVKKSLTGNGHAGKEQVREAVMTVLRLGAGGGAEGPSDVTDALAIAMCGAQRLIAAITSGGRRGV
ncbi:MAG TPA: crossover junction endodeoxyribonuclease RuvC [Phycisphaerales bacterium]|nr:crossover junction endodeoxyribonuclease RuvC [Phycisphaerales bacterium]